MPEHSTSSPKKPEELSCANCEWRRKSEENPKSFMSRLWRWHSTWCPGWKAYQKALADQKL